MHSEIDIQVNGQSMALPPDFSLDVTEENPLFHDVEMHSDPVQAPMEGNRHIFSNVDDPQSHQRPVDLEHTPAKWSVSGIPFRSGTIAIQEDDELDGAFSFNIDEARQSFNDLIGDLKCQDVPLYNNELIPIGEKICDVNVSGTYKSNVEVAFSGTPNFIVDNNTLPFSGKFNPQALGFSYPGICSDTPDQTTDKDKISIKTGGTLTYPDDIKVNVPKVTTNYINVSEPYNSNNGVPSGWRYCNARVCYTHHGLDITKKVDDVMENGKIKYKGTIGETTDDIMKVDEDYGNLGDFGPYWVLEAQRPQSGICFYVLYFLDCLFNYLGVTFDNSALTAIEDLRRLAFFTTKCKYITEDKTGDRHLTSLDAINSWLDQRGCGGRLEFSKVEDKDLDEVVLFGKTYKVGETYTWAESGWVSFTSRLDAVTGHGELLIGNADAYVRTMYATNENFPAEAVSTIISSLEASFGIRFRYDYQANKVTAYLMRDVFRQKDANGNAIAPITLPCEVLRVNKLSEKITGVRMKYSAESDGKEQMENIRRAKRDYETDFDYVDYRQDRTRVCDDYQTVLNDKHVENVTCYIDKQTANAYRYKISKEIDSGDIAYHRLFEVGQFKGIEVGDCSRANEDFVKEYVSDFQPMSWNDVNAYAQLKRNKTESVLCAYVDEDMEHEFVTQKINHTLAADDVDIYISEVLNLLESYDPTSTDDGNSPLQSYDWGLAIAVMRGGGTDALIENYAYGYDGFGNAKWRMQAGKYAMASDTMDQFGHTFDYNGLNPGDGGGERFSLKIRSWKPFLYYIDASGKTIVTSDLSLAGKAVEGVSGKTWLYPSNADAAVFRRGLADVFMSELFWFLLNRRKLRIHCLAEAAALVDIPNHWYRRFRIGDQTGYIDKFSYSISSETGIGEVTIDFYAV